MAKGPFIFGQVRVNHAGRIDEQVSCLHCGDALKGVAPDTVCPGCGKPVADSVRGDLLWLHSPAWLSRIGLGLMLVGLGVLLGLLFGGFRFLQLAAAAEHLPKFLMPLLDRLEALPPTLRMLIYVLPTVTAGLGLWFVTARQPMNFDPEPLVTWRRAAQWLAALAAGLAVLLFVIDGLASGWGTVPGLRTRVRLPWMFLIHLTWIASVMAAHVHTADLAGRVPDSRLARNIQIGAWFSVPALTFLYLYMDFTPLVLTQYRVSHTLADEGLPVVYHVLVICGYVAHLLILPAAGWTLMLIVRMLIRIRQATSRSLRRG